MRKLIAIAAVCMIGLLGTAMAAPSAEMGAPALGSASISAADAAIGRGGGQGGAGGDSAAQVAPRAASLLQTILASLLFIGAAIGISIAALKRDMGLAVVVIVLALIVGAFTLAPEGMENWFRSIYRYVL